MTILFDISGSSNILGEKFSINVDDYQHSVIHGQKTFLINQTLHPKNGWNTIFITHLDHPNDLTHFDNGKIINHSHVSFDRIKINNYELTYSMMNNSNLKVYNPNTNKNLYLYHLGEPFCIELNYYFPLEYWTFALASSESHFGRIGWKHA